MRLVRLISSVCLGGVCFAFAAAQITPLKTGAGAVAHNMCSSLFVAGLPEHETYRELVGGLIGPARFLSRYRVDPDKHTVDAWMLTAHARAVFHPGYGCRLVYPGDRPLPSIEVVQPPVKADETFAPSAPVQAGNSKLKAALDEMFDGASARNHVKAIVIVKDGRIVAEQYAPGYGIYTPVMSFRWQNL